MLSLSNLHQIKSLFQINITFHCYTKTLVSELNPDLKSNLNGHPSIQQIHKHNRVTFDSLMLHNFFKKTFITDITIKSNYWHYKFI